MIDDAVVSLEAHWIPEAVEGKEWPQAPEVVLSARKIGQGATHSTEGASFDSPGCNPGFASQYNVFALKGHDSAGHNTRKFYPSPFGECRPFRAMVRSRFAYPGLRFATPWAIEYDPFAVEEQGRTNSTMSR